MKKKIRKLKRISFPKKIGEKRLSQGEKRLWRYWEGSFVGTTKPRLIELIKETRKLRSKK